MDRAFQDASNGADLRELPEVHDGHPIRDVADRGHVVRDQQIGEALLLL